MSSDDKFFLILAAMIITAVVTLVLLTGLFQQVSEENVLKCIEQTKEILLCKETL